MLIESAEAYADVLSQAEAFRSFQEYRGGVFADVPAEKTRGNLIESVVRRWLGQKYGQETSDPDPGKDVLGGQRSSSSSEYDFKMVQLRWEIKSSQLQYQPAHDHWQAVWTHIKPEKHDRLVLVLYTPEGLDIYLHDGKSGKFFAGARQKHFGHGVVFASPNKVGCVATATAEIRKKMATMLLGSIDNATLSTMKECTYRTPTSQAYYGARLAALSACCRGRIVEHIVRQHTERRLQSPADNTEVGTTHSGHKRARHYALVDFGCAGLKFEVKSSQLRWSRNCWTCRWQKIKHHHDVLLLALILPTRILIYEHDGAFCVQHYTMVDAKNVCVSAPKHTAFDEAVTWVESKLAHLLVGVVWL